ncbi:basic leucine zipper 34 [Rhododendron vialii]|uniref:basic leucine zipper 34 n=1 Tax=Rhododendron vialii TaxID=182163 RepID=UPI00265F3068|nr:basic leucine zipper 34 [Rhododendron vialii]XP_058208039.1 basic leucine zipper 34 [Rhododendron vialii]XP_058208040.1 basic leucine zipper 34 [Rhododendron vialii]XP_058208041.1 basic leucine zipper 34 [Rhododendron vialii]XP_058208042.1 basic leucine zipper 34 [Rhododendron vialii]XP_058208043.1 basic leucine zipper 34 [Rhododendron vialii]XP_058208045.1 basic leucine zipper 34 [Rhododendron vialii]
MSRHAHLPPRCPFQKKSTTRSIYDPLSPSSCKELYPRHQKSISQSSILEEQPEWLDDLLGDSDANTKGTLHRRSVSDSMTLLDGLVSLNDDDSSVSSETGSGFESGCMYGPNSPRSKGKFTFPESTMVSALSDCLFQNPMEYLDGGLCASGMVHCEVQDGSGLAGEANAESKADKRHSGQRSRVRKLQYIAELERTVDVLQTLESELAVRVASLLQQRAALSMENGKLKQQMARLKKEKVIGGGRYQSLKKELERLKIRVAYSSSGDVEKDFRSSSAAEGVSLDAAWQMLDIGKLNLNARN